MRALFLLLVLILLGGGAVLLFDRPEPGESRSIEERPSAPDETEEPAQPEQPDKPSKKAETADESDEAAEWASLRPASERLVPDPDCIGPCPPAHLGGHPTRVIRRYLDPDNGYKTWVHEDGAVTQISFTREESGTPGEKLSRRVILTSVPTEPKPIAPGDR
ncbi:MAG: hypothetical protein ACE5F1_06300 [Planctomycetota bacterium]